MKLDVRHNFPCDPDTFWKMYWDDSFDAMLQEGNDVARELIEERTEGEVVIRRIRFTPERELPTPVAKLIGSNKLIYEQENRWDPAAGVLTWKVIPTVLPGKLDAQGTFTVRPAAGGCEQVVQGEIVVNVRFIGGQIEKAVVAEVKQSYDRMAEICRRWLSEHHAS